MSSALAIPAVTAVLRHYLHGVYNSPDSHLSSVAVSAKAPDVVQSELGAGANQQLQVNLFLHQVMPNAAWRNIGLPSLAPDGVTALKNPPLGLDLHYLLTVYATEDSHAEALLGFAVAFLHDNPVLVRSQIAPALNALPSNSFCDGLRACGLANQIEMIKITPATLGREEMAWLWTALKADYRPTFPFQVSVVLIQQQGPAASGLPVLHRRVHVHPNLAPPFATITEADPPNGQSAAWLGDTVTVNGSNLVHVSSVLLSTNQQGNRQTITSLLNVGDTSFQFVIPNPNLPPPQNNPTDLPAGFYVLTATVGSGTHQITTNSVPLAIAAKILTWPGTLASGSSVSVAVTCAPYLRPSQQVSLLIGGQQAPPDPFTSPTNSPSFTFRSLQPTGGKVPIWLRVDGVDGPIINPGTITTPPTFSGPFTQVS